MEGLVLGVEGLVGLHGLARNIDNCLLGFSKLVPVFSENWLY